MVRGGDTGAQDGDTPGDADTLISVLKVLKDSSAVGDCLTRAAVL